MKTTLKPENQMDRAMNASSHWLEAQKVERKVSALYDQVFNDPRALAANDGPESRAWLQAQQAKIAALKAEEKHHLKVAQDFIDSGA